MLAEGCEYIGACTRPRRETLLTRAVVVVRRVSLADVVLEDLEVLEVGARHIIYVFGGRPRVRTQCVCVCVCVCVWAFERASAVLKIAAAAPAKYAGAR